MRDHRIERCVLWGPTKIIVDVEPWCWPIGEHETIIAFKDNFGLSRLDTKDQFYPISDADRERIVRIDGKWYMSGGENPAVSTISK